MRSSLKVVLGVVALLLLSALVTAVSWGSLLDPRVGTAVTAIATALAALSSAVAALAAWRAAARSDETSFRATRALGAAMAPVIRIRDEQDPHSSDPDAYDRVLEIWNPSRWPASDLDVSVDFAKDRPRRHFDFLSANQEDNVGRPMEPARFEFRAHNLDEGGGKRTVQIRYSDQQGICRWLTEFELWVQAGPPYASNQMDVWGRTTMIEKGGVSEPQL
jgi:hypothetical protein